MTRPLSPLLEVRNLAISFDHTQVVGGINFEINQGERLALVGESGSGKTITALSLLGLARGARVSGECLFEGENLFALPEPKLRMIRGRDIAMIFQEPMTALNPLFTVGDQIAEVLELKMAMPRRAAWDRAVELMQDTGIADSHTRARSYPHQLSGGQRQRVMIAMALACKPKLLLADEPTTALDASLRIQILELLARFQQEYKMSILMITHDLNLVKSFANRVIVMQKGQVVEHGVVGEVMRSPKNSYTKALIDSVPVRHVIELSELSQRMGSQKPRPFEMIATESPSDNTNQYHLDALISAKNLTVSYPVPLAGFKGWFKKGEFFAVKNASFEVLPYQTLGVVGESGSGKSTLALACLGLLQSQGDLRVMGQPWSQREGSRLRALRANIQVVFQDPFSSLSPRMTVFELVGEGLCVHSPEIDVSKRQAKVISVLGEVGLVEAQFPGLLERYPHEFSGGQRQRLSIARALILSPRVLVLDEPTSALDVTSQRQVIELLQALQRTKGLSYLLITHDMSIIKAMAHHVLVMKDGFVVESGTVNEIIQSPREAYTQLLVNAAG